MSCKSRHALWRIAATLLLLLSACGNHDNSRHEAADGGPRRGGVATILLDASFAGAWPAGLDPATNVTGGANISLMNAIFGGLFQLTANEDGTNPRIVGVLASGYEVRDEGRSIIIHLRPEVTFSDGTPFDSEAVKFNIERALQAPCACSPAGWPWAKQERVTAPDAHTVVLHFASPYAPIMNGFPTSNINWIASPTAFRRLGADGFKITPVGAGPFRVVSNQLSARLVLERNPHYFQKDRPYLDRLIFQSIGGDQAGYQALLAGNAQAFEAMTAPLLIQQAQKNPGLTVTTQPATSPGVIQLNTAVPPFNDQRAREAIYYATDPEAIRQGVFQGRAPVTQSFTGPGGLFYHDRIPGYRTYDLQKARSRVAELGTLKVTLGTLRAPVAQQLITTLQTQWAKAGIEVKLEMYDLGTLIGKFQSGAWQAMLQTAGSFDPEVGSGLRFRFGIGSPFSGVKDPQLDQLITSAVATFDPRQRDQLYLRAASYLGEKAYAPFLVAQGPAQVTRGIYGPGLTTRIPPILINTGILWQDVWMVAAR